MTKQLRTCFTRSVVIGMVLLSGSFLLHRESIQAQSSLTHGDLVFTGYNINGLPAEGDTFSFVLLANISSGTKVSFTDQGYVGGRWLSADASSEGTVTWTSGSALPLGTLVEIYGLTARVYNQSTGSFTTNGSVVVSEGGMPNGLNLSNVGDQIIAFQSSNNTVSDSYFTTIAGLHYFNCSASSTTTAAWDATCGNTNGSAMPPGLTGGYDAFWTGVSGTSIYASGHFNCNGIPFTSSAIRSAIMDVANWTLATAEGGSVSPMVSCANIPESTLPVRLASFTVSNSGIKGLLRWTTLQEESNLAFLVQRSADGKIFTTISSVPSQAVGGYSDSKLSYSFTDENPLEGISYYRIGQQDYNGHIQYSAIQKMDLLRIPSAFSVYPNPVRNYVNIQYVASSASVLKYRVTDASGRAVLVRNWSVTVGTNVDPIAFQKLNSGTYYLDVETSGKPLFHTTIVKP